MTRTPTREQQDVLDSPARVRVVRATPGSGKTWLVAELIRRDLENRPRSGGGIAALSFTRVGGEEIRKALGYDLGHPHFVGTIDAFLFRYVVRPFLQKARPIFATPRLIPADWEPKHWRKAPGNVELQYRRLGDSQSPIYDLLDICFIDEVGGQPITARQLDHGRGMEKVDVQDRAGVIAAKRLIWQRLGWLTHADAAFLASELLAEPTIGSVIKKILLRRFPLLVVDELQDTGFFLGKSIRLLLSEPQIRGVLVGDPDQAIFEFNGARPDLFDGFNSLPGASLLPLARSQRCPAAITACAVHLKGTPGQIDPVEGKTGRSFLVRYTDMGADIRRLVRAIREATPTSNSKVIVRWNSTIAELTSEKGVEIESLRKPALTHMARSVQNFRRGHQTRALAGARAALELAVLGQEGFTDEDLLAKGIDPRDWKALAVKCLLQADAIDSALSMQEWQTTAGTVIDAAVQAFGLPIMVQFVAGKLRPQNFTGKNRTKVKAGKAFADFAPRSAVNATTRDCLTVETIHAVKGETHDVTVFVCPPTSANRRCPSVAWWPSNSSDGEERRIAYVAMTRTRTDLVLCVSEACDQQLGSTQTAFVRAFQRRTVDECIAAFAATGALLCHQTEP